MIILSLSIMPFSALYHFCLQLDGDKDVKLLLQKLEDINRNYCLSICIPEDKRSEVALDMVGDCVCALDCKCCIEELAGVVLDELAIADETAGIDPLQVLPADVNWTRTAKRKAVPFISDLENSGAWRHKNR